ncbi:MAG: DUF1932 domain-containing protein [Pseudomonadota bacterium]
MSIKKVALIGFGEVGQILGAELALLNKFSQTAFDVAFSDDKSNPAKAANDSVVRKALSSDDCVRGADLVISAVTAASTVEAAAAAASALTEGTWYLDLNSASPHSKADAAAAINKGGGRYVEASVMSPIEPKRLGAPIFLGGPYARAFEPIAKAIGFSDANFYSERPGKTAAAKLCRSVVIKGMEALISESLLAAHHYGVEDDVIASLENLFPHPDWRSYASYMINRTLQHGGRRSEEMQEAARTVSDAGVTPWMARATVERQAFAGDLKINATREMLTPLLEDIRVQTKNLARK